MADGTPARGEGSARVQSLDLLRGFAMVAMALDHTRDFFTNLTFDPETLELTWGSLFFTRWVTHLCAPLFFFLAGTGAWFYGRRHSPAELRRFLLTRGLWLIVLEFTLVGTAWTFVFPWGFFGVIWALGASMLILSVLVRLPVRGVAVVGGVVVVLHDLFDAVRPDRSEPLAWLWGLLHVKGGISIAGFGRFVLFPLVPWFAVMALGYAFGAVFERGDRRRFTAILGAAAVVLFVVLRATNLYGNPPALPGGVTPGDFSLQPTLEKTVILFLDTEKYPPSLQFLLMTLGPSLLALAWLEGRRLDRWAAPLVVFGRVPLFFYVVHLYVVHAAAVVVAMLAGQPWAWLLHGGFWLNDWPEGYGHALPFVWAAWAAVVAALYLPCRWFAGLKGRRREWWLSYL